MRIAGKRLPACALLLVVSGCIHRPLGEADDGGATVSGVAGQGGATGQGGGIGTGCSGGDPGLELIGTPLTVLDQPPTGGNLYTSLVWTGEQYLFIWRLIGGADVLMQRIDANGQAVGGNIRVRDFEYALDVAWGSSRLAAAWTRKNETGGTGTLMFQTFDGLGRPLIDESTLRAAPGIDVDGSVMYGPRIAPMGDGFALVWGEAGQILVATAALDGHLARGPVVTSIDLSSPTLSLAATDDRLVIGWNGRPTASPTGPPLTSFVTATRAFSSAITSLGGANTVDGAAFGGLPQVLATDGGFLALWTHGLPAGSTMSPADAEVRITQLDGTGASLANGIMDPPVRGSYPYLVPAVWNGDHLVVLWGGTTPADTGLTLTRFAPGGARQGASLNLPTSVPPSSLFLTAHDGILAFIWSEEIDRGYEVYFQRARSCP